MRYLILLSVCCRLAVASATTVYITRDGAGSQDGSSLLNAGACDATPATPQSTCAFFNNASNWGSGAKQIGAGTTVHLGDDGVAITATANASSYLSFQAGGSGGSPITLLFGPGAVLTSPAWGGSAIALGSYSYITINGGTNGIIQATLNGTSGASCIGGSCMYQQGGGIGVNGYGSNQTVENLTVQDLYVRSGTTDVSDQNTLGINTGLGSNVTITNNVVHDVHWAVGYGVSGSGATNIQVSKNNIYNTDHGVFVGNASTGTNTVNGIYIFGNHIHDFANWDEVTDTYHHDGVHVFINDHSGSTATYQNIIVYNNLIDGNWGTYDNAGIYLESADNVSAGGIVSCSLFNNVMNPSGGASASGAFADYSQNGCLNANNDVYGQAYSVEFTKANGATLYNNIGVTQYTVINGGDGGMLTASNYNDWYNTQGTNQFIPPSGYCCLASLSSWISTTGFDTNSITANPNLNSSYVPNTGSPVIGAGTNLYSTCNGQSNPGLGALCYDAAGNPRPSSGAWTIGAYNYIPPPGSISSSTGIASSSGVQ